MTGLPDPPSRPPIATASDLPPAVAAALHDPPPPRERRVGAAGIAWATREWGDPAATPLLLLHGVTSSAAVWWRIGPALAAAGFHVVAPDLPGHGRTGSWLGHHRFADNARDVRAFTRAAGVAQPDLHVVGHSWGAMTAAGLARAGIRPARLVLVDPPAIPVATIARMLEDPVEHRYDDRAAARAAIRSAYPGWSDGDVNAKAEALTQFDEDAVRSVLLDNGDWDGGLADLADPAGGDVPTWIVRGDPAAGGYVPDEAVPRLVARVGAERLLTIGGAPHSPHRTHPEATLVALLTALGRCPRAGADGADASGG